MLLPYNVCTKGCMLLYFYCTVHLRWVDILMELVKLCIILVLVGHTVIPTCLPTYLPTYIHSYIHTYMLACIHIRNMLILYLLYVLYIGMFMCHRRALVSQFHMKQADNKKLVWPNAPPMSAHNKPHCN